jgi:hypothetical protein
MCPSCRSNDVSRSRKRKLKDRFMRWLGKVAYRCRDCHRRFYVTLDVDKRLHGVHEWQKKTQEHATNGGKKKRSRAGAEDPLNDYGEDFEL